MYAIIQKNGHQYKVTSGEELDIDRIPFKEGEKLSVKEVLLISDGPKVKIGEPYVAGSEVVLKVVKHTQGDKIRVSRFKAKSRYNRTTGFRADLTKVLVEAINVNGEKKEVVKKPVRRTRKSTTK